MDAIAQENPHKQTEEKEDPVYLRILSVHKVFSILRANRKWGAECSTAVYWVAYPGRFEPSIIYGTNSMVAPAPSQKNGWALHVQYTGQGTLTNLKTEQRMDDVVCSRFVTRE